MANDQLHVPAALVPDLLTDPTEALSVTVSPAFASDQVPELEAVAPSFTVTDALFLAIAGAALLAVAVTVDVLLVPWPPDENVTLAVIV